MFDLFRVRVAAAFCLAMIPQPSNLAAQSPLGSQLARPTANQWTISDSVSRNDWTASDAAQTGDVTHSQTATQPTNEATFAQPAPTSQSGSCCHGTWIDWSLYPATSHPMPRPGIFPIPPSDRPGYFTGLDALTGTCRNKPRKSGYVPFAINAYPFFDADWRFVDDIATNERTLVERLKRIRVGDCWMLATGGQYWLKYHHEQNSRLTESVNDYTLLNVRLYSDLWYGDRLRLYGEYVWADSINEELLPAPPDVDRGDIQNLFFDLKLFEFHEQPVYVRAGRQELLYGSQRMVTPLPWANKRHTFQGVKMFRHGKNWDHDLFWTQFVPPDASGYDQADSNQTVAGSWMTYRPESGQAIDWYYLFYENGNSIVQQGIDRTPTETHTLGSRWSGSQSGRLWDVEGALQFGDQANQDLVSGMGTIGIGRNWKNLPGNPTAWLYYDYASGDATPGAGNANTYNQLFPFGHYYLGWTDIVGRQNIHDINAHLYVYPQNWITCWVQYHHFSLAQSEDALYNAGGRAIRRDPTGQSGNHVGDEVDLVVNFHLTNYSDILVSYNRLFGGDFLENTSGPNQASDTEAFYLIYQRRW